MKATEIIARVISLGGKRVRQKGSHVRIICRCGTYASTVPDHNKDVALGTTRAIERHLAPCFGKGWLR